MTADFTIVGQGLAGTALAWLLRWHGARVQVIDRGDAITASKIAAGLITPITGKRFALDPDYESDFKIAEAFYRRVENETNAKYFHQHGAVRLLRDDVERERFHAKDGLKLYVADVALDANHFLISRGCFAMPSAARLDVPTYLNASRKAFAGDFRIGSFDDTDSTVIDCTGIAAMREQRLPAELFQPAKGEILTLRIPGFREDRTIHHGIWLARIAEDRFRAGATYSWDVLDDAPTPAGREELVTCLGEFLKVPFEVIGHEAATRPIAIDRQPIVRRLAPQRWAFNGLGSKGALLAPRLAHTLAESLR